MFTSLIALVLGVLAFAVLLVPEPSALVGVPLPLWFGPPDVSAWDGVQAVLRISGVTLLTFSLLHEAARRGWSKRRIQWQWLGGGTALLSLMCIFLLPTMTDVVAGWLLVTLLIGTGLALSARDMPERDWQRHHSRRRDA